jgi:hypothetical protein
MAEAPQPGPPDVPALRARLHEVAGLLRQGTAVDATSFEALAELVDELGEALKTAALPTAEVRHLADSTAQLAESLHRRHDRGLLGRARDRLSQAAVDAEAHAPTLVGVVRRLIDALANIGI